jgi:hypothetical protein
MAEYFAIMRDTRDNKLVVSKQTKKKNLVKIGQLIIKGEDLLVEPDKNAEHALTDLEQQQFASIIESGSDIPVEFGFRTQDLCLYPGFKLLHI